MLLPCLESIDLIREELLSVIIEISSDPKKEQVNFMLNKILIRLEVQSFY